MTSPELLVESSCGSMFLLQLKSTFKTVVGDLLPLNRYHLQLHLIKYSAMIDPHQMGSLL